MGIATSHFESYPEDTAWREKQFRNAVAYTSKHDVAAIMGDTNIIGKSEDTPILSSGFVDAWPTLHPDNPGFSRDPTRNTFAKDGVQQRIDRMYLRLDSKWYPKMVELIGTEPLRTVQESYPVYPSDHFGLHGIIQAS